ncbi:MAG: hypothetical protein ABIS20_13820 [Thermoanaerobaculia bacterium]
MPQGNLDENQDRSHPAAGSLEVREFTGGEDPLNPSTDTGDPIATDTFTGRRVKAHG